MMEGLFLSLNKPLLSEVFEGSYKMELHSVVYILLFLLILVASYACDL